MADYYGLSSGVIFEWPLEISFAERNNFTYSFNDHIAPQKNSQNNDAGTHSHDGDVLWVEIA